MLLAGGDAVGVGVTLGDGEGVGLELGAGVLPPPALPPVQVHPPRATVRPAGAVTR
jgi:hypothetical protein